MKLTFTKPHLDGPFSLLEIIFSHAAHSFDHPLFKYMDVGGDIQVIVWGEAVKAFNLATQYTMKNAGSKYLGDSQSTAASSTPPVMGILANLDSITYYSLLIGIMNAGFTPFPISPRNSSESVARLLESTGCETVFVSDDLPIQKLSESSFALYRQRNPGRSPIHSCLTPFFEDLYSKDWGDDGNFPIYVRKIVDHSTPCVIIHSSGTASFPKPIEISYRMFFEHALLIGLEGDTCGSIVSVHATPMYHLMGLRSISHSAILGVTLSVFRPSKPPIFASPDVVLKGSVETLASRILCPPAFLESWAAERSDVEKLKQFDCIMFGGGPLQSPIGDMLNREGVCLMPTLGLTEVGPITSYFPRRNRTEGWNWFHFSPFLDLKFIEEEGHVDEVYRMIVKKNEFKTPAVLNTNIEGVPAYDTKDLYIKHPTNSDLWRIIGRADDQIMHSTGEKTNPIPIEAKLTKCPDISQALIFGQAKFQVGALIFPAPDHIFDTEELEKKKSYIELIWPAIVTANSSSPQHSRIFKETIIIASSSKHCEYTTKGTVRRAVTLDKYKLEIDALYRNLDANPRNSPFESGPARTPDFEDILHLVRDAVHAILDESLRDDEDIFQAGADSLCTLSIRNTLLQRFRSSKLICEESTHMLPRDILYVLPSISKLSAFIYGLSHFEAEKGNIYRNGHQEKKSGPPDNQTADEKWQTILKSKETVVKIVERPWGIPLIILHGAFGIVATLSPFRKCTESSIWVIQMTDEAPHDSLEALALFYYRKIKASRPNGPYRLASFSGSCVLLVELAMIFQRNDDRIVQFDMLDHFPTYYFPELNPDLVHLEDPEWFAAHVKQSIRGMIEVISHTKNELSAATALRMKELEVALNGGQVSPTINLFIQRTTWLISMSLSYLLSDRFMETVDLGDGTQRKRWSPKLFRSFGSGIQPRLTVYIAKQGIRIKTPAALISDFEDDLGARMYFPDAQILHVEGQHVDFLEDGELLKRIQTNFTIPNA